MFHTPKAKKFYIPPRFYDPDKEERELREKRIRDELGLNDNKPNDDRMFRPNIKGTFRAGMSQRANAPNDIRRANRTRLIIFIIILVLVYLFFFKFNFSFFK
jgi:hypothetical protein